MTIGIVTILGADRLALVGTFQAGSGATPRPTLLLLHMLGADRADWQTLAVSLKEAGYNTLALDMRGHGDSGGARDWALAAADHSDALLHLDDGAGHGTDMLSRAPDLVQRILDWLAATL